LKDTNADFEGFPLARTVTLTLHDPVLRPLTPELRIRQFFTPLTTVITEVDRVEGRSPDALITADFEKTLPTRNTFADFVIGFEAGTAVVVVVLAPGVVATGSVQLLL
jgi:hypothetical protein